MDDQRRAPILEALTDVQRDGVARFGAPGHGAGSAATADVLKVVGRRAFEADLLTPKGLDDRTERRQALQRAHALAAQAWGADLCRFSTGGSTQSLHTALTAVARPGDTVLIAQNSHKATFAAAVFAGLDLALIQATISTGWDIEHGLSIAAAAAALDAHPEAKAMLVVSPSYFGITSDIPALAALCHARGVPLIVDAAWGAAFGFSDRLPANPVAGGADIVVTSVHKTLAALGQGSAMLVSGTLVDQTRFALAYELFETTSPSIAILASLDATRREHACHGQRIWDTVLDLAHHARDRLGGIAGLRLLDRDELDGDGACDLDETKIVIDVSGLGISGYAADDWLTEQHKVSAGLSDLSHLLFIVSAGTTASEVRRLIKAVRALAKVARRGGVIPAWTQPSPALRTLTVTMAMSAQQAFAAQVDLVAYEHCAGRIAAEIIAPAPPGVPRLIPGQVISAAHVEYLVSNRDAGCFILDPADPAQQTIRVVANRSAESEPRQAA